MLDADSIFLLKPRSFFVQYRSDLSVAEKCLDIKCHLFLDLLQLFVLLFYTPTAKQTENLIIIALN